MGENGTLLHHGSSAMNGAFTNGGSSETQQRHSSSSSSSKHKRKETEEERRLRKERERREREERHKREGRRDETEEERRIRKEKERKDREERLRREGRREETEEERKIRKEKERREREERHKREGRRDETEEERRIRKEKERKEREERHRREGRRDETEEERRLRKEKERREREQRHHHKSKETEEERRARKDRERLEKEMARKEGEGHEDSSLAENPFHDPQSQSNDVKDEEDVDDEEEEDSGHHQRNHPQHYLNEYQMKQEEQMAVEVKHEPQEESDDDMPLATKKTKSKKRKSRDEDDESEDDIPLSKRKKPKTEKKTPKPSKAKRPDKIKESSSPTKTSGGRKKKKEEGDTVVWKWWEETKVDDGTKWKYLEHKGPLFAPDYIPLPKGVNFYYNGKKMKLSLESEEVAGFYGRMIDHDYTEKEVFNLNFFKDWRKVMSPEEREIITHLNKCDFREIDAYYKRVSEERKNRSKEEKKAEKEKNAAIQEEYGVCIIDNHKEKIGNFRIEPPGLFRGRGEHPKQGMLKKRVIPEDVIINCSKDSKFPEPPPGHKWKEIRHDNTVTWLASWTENIQNQIKYVMLNPSSKLKGEKDMLKYEKARELKSKIEKIRDDYVADFKSKEMRVRQRSVALYFIDKLALRAGNEKDEDQADTVGCCSLRVEHITLHPEKDGKEYCVEFDFLGKDSIRYHNIVPVEKRVFKNLQLFMENKKGEDDLFDRLNTTILNEYLNSLMKGLTAKVFRTFNASFTLQEQLEELTDPDDNVPAKMLSYNRANRKVAILCNHQRAAPKTHDKSMQNLQAKIQAKREAVEKAEKELKSAKKAYKNGGSSAEKMMMDKKKKALERTVEQLDKLETQAVDKEENKTIALGTSKLNYLDPRISVAWSKKFDVPIEKIFNKTQRDKFRWAIEMAGADYVF